MVAVQGPYRAGSTFVVVMVVVTVVVVVTVLGHRQEIAEPASNTLLPGSAETEDAEEHRRDGRPPSG